MDNTVPSIRRTSPAGWRALVWPREHGSWSLAFEPVAFGLIAAPSASGGWLAIAITAAFFARRPLRMAWRDARADAWVAFAVCGTAAGAALAAAISVGGPGWLVWLLPSALAGVFFLTSDLRNAGRDGSAEVAGAATFALLPAAFAALAGYPATTAAALAVVMCGRAVPTVLCVRAAVRAAKTGVKPPSLALAATFAALAAGFGLARGGHAPTSAVVALSVLALRALALLVFPRPTLRARTIGMIEGGLGLAFVALVGTTWNL